MSEQIKVAAPRSIWYHGSSIKNLRSILVQGLVPEVKKKNWDQDNGAGIHTPSRESYGGIYVTQNLITATGAPRDHYTEGRVVVVSMELQPNTFFADEDDITGPLNSPLQHVGDNQWHVGCNYIAARDPQANSGWTEMGEEYKTNYIDGCLRRFKHHMEERKLTMHPDLEKRLTELLGNAWLPAVARVAAHMFLKDKSNYEFSRCWSSVYGSKTDIHPCPDRSDFLPTIAEAEAEFRKHAEQITRTLRQIARPLEVGLGNTARVDSPIGYSGSNHILAVAEVRDSGKYRAKSGDPAQIIVHYGTLPGDFLEQWRQRVGDNFQVIEGQKKAASLTPNTAEIATLKEIEPRAGQEFEEWLFEFIGDAEEFQEAWADESLRLDYLRDWLRDEHQIDVQDDGYITFWKVNTDVERLIGDLPVTVFHHTSSGLLSQIKKEGLRADTRKSNSHQNSGAGVYVTTEVSGPAVEGYKRNAVRRRKGHPVTLEVHTTLSELEPDPDDADIASGAVQFVLPYVAPKDIVFPTPEKRRAAEEPKFRPWIGVDLDDTVAVALDDYSDPTKIGEPIPAMIEKVRTAIKNGETIKVFTARMADKEHADKIRTAIGDWTEKHVGTRLDATNEKDPGMVEFWDDKARQVEPGTGMFSVADITLVASTVKVADHYNEDGFRVGDGGGASGILPICKETKRIGLAWRSSEVNQGDCWGTLGGAIQRGKSPAESAQSELQEETGYHGGIKMHPAFVFSSGSFKYFNFIGEVDEEFELHPEPGFGWETDHLTWITLEELEADIENNPGDYHSGVVALFTNSYDLIKRLTDGEDWKTAVLSKNPALKPDAEYREGSNGWALFPDQRDGAYKRSPLDAMLPKVPEEALTPEENWVQNV